MEDNTDNQSKTPASAPELGGSPKPRLMDIQPPKPASTPQADTPPVAEEAPNAPTMTDSKTDGTLPMAEGPTDDYSGQTPQAETAEITPPPAKHNLPDLSKDADTTGAGHLLTPHASKPKHGPVLVIIIAVIIAAALIGVTVFAYMQSQDTKKDTDHPAEQTTAPATTGDVDNTTKEVDDAVNSVDDAKDMPESDLTDQTLGL